jgi:hypothetical protein
MQSNAVGPYESDLDLIGPVSSELRGSSPDQKLSSVAEARLLHASVRAHVDDLSRLMTTVSDALTAVENGSSATSKVIGDIAARTVPRWHFAMLNDHERNDAFAVALERRIKPGSHVLDIGSGTGLLAMMAIDAGAGRVTTCEANPLLAEITRQVVEAHGMSSVIKVIPKMSTDLVVGHDLDEPADLIVSETVDCGLVGEGMFRTMRHARRELLGNHGELLPESARIFGFLVDSPVAVGLNRVGDAGGYDVRLLNTVGTRGHFPIRLNTWPHRVLSDTVLVADFDFHTDSLTDDHRLVTLPVTADGVVHAMVLWFEIDLGAGVAIRNSPENVGSHWMQALILFERPVPVAAGSALQIDVRWRHERLTTYVNTPSNSLEGKR